MVFVSPPIIGSTAGAVSYVLPNDTFTAVPDVATVPLMVCGTAEAACGKVRLSV